MSNTVVVRTTVYVEGLTRQEILAVPYAPKGAHVDQGYGLWEGVFSHDVKVEVLAPTFQGRWVNEVCLRAFRAGEDAILAVMEDGTSGIHAWVVTYVKHDDFIRWEALS